jgi:glycosyltransferase involved in cell wall biosynthesis
MGTSQTADDLQTLPRSMSKQSISLAMTTFNGARYLREQLTSLSSQSVKPSELVVCDDGSTDETVSILKSFSAQAPFEVRIFQNAQRLGYQQNFIKAASLCKGALIAFCDQDDIWEDDKLSVVSKYFMQSDDLLVTHDYSVFFEDGRQLIPSYFGHLALSGRSPVVNLKGCSLIFRRKLIELVGWPPPQSAWSHDLWVCFTALLLEKRGWIRQSLIRHRIHGTNTSGWIKSEASRQRLLLRFRVPPFTSSNDLDVFIALFVTPINLAAYRQAVEQCALAMTNDQRQSALSALAKRQAVCNFIRSKAYSHPLRRTLGAVALFLRRAYRDGDGVLGFLQDILGRRTLI